MTNPIIVRQGDYEYEIRRHRSVDEFDIPLLRRLRADRSLITLAQVGEMVNADATQLSQWKRAMENYLLRGHTEWPPSRAVLRAVVGKIISEEPLLDGLPPWDVVLPPPAIHGRRYTAEARWYKGDIYLWGWRTRRIDFDGNPLVGPDRAPGREKWLVERRLPRRRRVRE